MSKLTQGRVPYTHTRMTFYDFVLTRVNILLGEMHLFSFCLTSKETTLTPSWIDEVYACTWATHQ